MPTTAQLLKAFGHLPNVDCRDLDNAAIDTRFMSQVLEDRQCGHPDEYDPEIAAHDDPHKLASVLSMPSDQCAGLIHAHRQMNVFAESRSAYPKGCNPEYPNSYSITHFLDRSSFPEWYTRPVRDEELEQIMEAKVWRWSREEVFDTWSGVSMLTVANDLVTESYRLFGLAVIERESHGGENIHTEAANLRGSTIGMGWFPNGTCGAHVKRQLSRSYRPGLMGTAKLHAHEGGHNLGENHQFSGQNVHRSVMSYNPPRLFMGFSTGKAPYSLPRDRSLDSLIRKFGGKPNPPITDKPNPPNPKPPTTPGTDPPISLIGPVFIDGRVRRLYLQD